MIEIKQRYSAGEFLKMMILEERGLTQKWLAQEIGCAERKISEICNNKRWMSAKFALDLEEWKKRPITDEYVYLWADGGPGLWSAIRTMEEFKNVKEQRCQYSASNF